MTNTSLTFRHASMRLAGYSYRFFFFIMIDPLVIRWILEIYFLLFDYFLPRCPKTGFVCIPEKSWNALAFFKMYLQVIYCRVTYFLWYAVHITPFSHSFRSFKYTVFVFFQCVIPDTISSVILLESHVN